MQPILAQPNEPRVSVLAARLVEHIAPLEFGTLLNFRALRKVIFEDPQASRGNRAIQQAKRLLLRKHQKALVSVRNVGYEVTLPKQQKGLSSRSQAAGMRRYKRALEYVQHVEREKLTAAELQENDQQFNRMAILIAVNRRVAKAALPAREQARIPSGKELAALLTKRSRGEA